MLNKQDFLTAMEFLEEGMTMNLYCHTFNQIPYLRRFLYQIVGEPDRTDGYTFRYPEFTIKIDSVVSAESKDELESGFYVSKEDGKDWIVPLLPHELSPEYVFLDEMGFCEADVSNWEAREGVTNEH